MYPFDPYVQDNHETNQDFISSVSKDLSKITEQSIEASQQRGILSGKEVDDFVDNVLNNFNFTGTSLVVQSHLTFSELLGSVY